VARENFPASKTRIRGEAQAAHTSHKSRSEWFQQRAAYPFREAEPDALTAWRRARLTRPAPGAPWRSLGPRNISGRLTAVAIHPARPERVFVGAAGGGVWRSLDGYKGRSNNRPRTAA
jgi:hypothetical protein